MAARDGVHHSTQVLVYYQLRHPKQRTSRRRKRNFVVGYVQLPAFHKRIGESPGKPVYERFFVASSVQPAGAQYRRHARVNRKRFLFAENLMFSIYADRRRLRGIRNKEIRVFSPERVVCRKMYKPDAVVVARLRDLGRKHDVGL